MAAYRGRTNWWPCRVCGVDHKNPQSSSICPKCGKAEREENLRLQAEYMANRTPRERLMDCDDIHELKNWIEENLL